MWTEANLADPSENRGQRLRSIFLDDPRITLPDDAEFVSLSSFPVSPRALCPQNAH